MRAQVGHCPQSRSVNQICYWYCLVLADTSWYWLLLICADLCWLVLVSTSCYFLVMVATSCYWLLLVGTSWYCLALVDANKICLLLTIWIIVINSKDCCGLQLLVCKGLVDGGGEGGNRGDSLELFPGEEKRQRFFDSFTFPETGVKMLNCSWRKKESFFLFFHIS